MDITLDITLDLNRLGGAIQSCLKSLGSILVIKFKKLMFSKNVDDKKIATKFILFNEKNQKDLDDLEN